MAASAKNNRREKPQELNPQKRKLNFHEVCRGFNEKRAIKEAGRCLNCKNPKCRESCPLYIDIPAFIKLIKDGNIAAAGAKISETYPFARICGRVCPQEHQCEKGCVLSARHKPVAIGLLEKCAADAFALMKKNAEKKLGSETKTAEIIKNGKKVAAVGSGPASLMVAYDLANLGYEVTIFEALHKFGGVLAYGIPEFRLPKKIVDEEIKFLAKLNIKFVADCAVGKTKTLNNLLREFDAVFLGLGAGTPKFLGIAGENLCGVYSANEYLTRVNLMKANLFPKYDTPIIKGKTVIILGGGNVALDAARTAVRMKAEKVTIIYRRSKNEMPCRKEELRHAEEEGVEFLWLSSPLRLIGENGWLKKAECIKMELTEPDEKGRKNVRPINNSNFSVNCDLAIIAVGASSNKILLDEEKSIATNHAGHIIIDDDGKTSQEKVWAGGDIVSGSATVISAMAAGRKAAKSIHKYISLAVK